MMKNVLAALLCSLVNARVLEENGGDYAFLADYTLQYQGCGAETQWVEGDIVSKELVYYKLCGGGCDECNGDDYGEYIVSLATFTQSALTHICENCNEDCDNENGGCDDCAVDDDAMLGLCDQDLEGYLACQEFNDNNGRKKYRFLEEEQKTYVSAYCDIETSTIQLGLFSEDTCTTLASDFDSGFTMPDFASQCMACNDELCETVYPLSGKCENTMGGVDNPSDDSCQYIAGTFKATGGGSSKMALWVTTGVLAVVGLAAAVYLRRRKIDLESSGDFLAK